MEVKLLVTGIKLSQTMTHAFDQTSTEKNARSLCVRVYKLEPIEHAVYEVSNYTLLFSFEKESEKRMEK